MGMLELGLTFDFGQMVLDAEIARMNKRILDGIRTDADTIGLDSIRRVGSDGDFLREKQTRALAAREQSQARVIDRRMRGAWEKRGGQDAHTRALTMARDILAEHVVPPLPAEAEAVIAEIFGRRAANKGGT
jgi:trimethylamine--corrinoid protein Co-methyltransferase